MREVANDEMMEQEDTQKDKFLIFKIEDESYAIDIQYVTEIIGIQEITKVPELPEYIKGIINLRGKIIPVMDVRIRFKRPQVEYNDRTCIIVIDVKNVSIGLIVDIVAEVINIEEENIVPPPQSASTENKYIKGIAKVGDEVRLILDSKELLSEDKIASLEIVQ